MANISVLGLGAMGQALAAQFLQQGHSVTLWNRTAGKAGFLVAKGARESSSAADAIASSDVTVICVLDYAASNAVLDSAASVLAGRAVVNLTNGTPAQARATAERLESLGAAYLDGGIMATPPMIGGEHALILYSGSNAAFEAHVGTLKVLGAATYLGADAGLASLHDLALLSGMYGVFAGFFHATALVSSEGIGASAFLKLLGPWMTAMMGELPGYAEKIDTGRHGVNVASNLAMQTAALENILTATREQGVATDLLDPMLDLFRKRDGAGHGNEDISGVFELIRSRNSAVS
ncbi:NAD-binding 6-phosphogluconate dehydrogenase protein [Rhizobium etli bv. mimosae str. IE4771]|uniref:NAD-binding 6-phosphogluconate dehydrogenase protein n=1 Tax=Rhizobium etli bv. mimosae str. IE4771 TaxID=1432050 RepID=A0A060HXH9_RHIET|nr:NAD(P)-binding domain-containing protein [Rhizobium sp. IE4771]AIC26302.1 NAD-binding 6-phosphogluconate dehydrogenase protein [Rhizobium sp. IE4771]